MLGGNANMHWLVSGVSGLPEDERAVLRRYGPWRSEAEVAYELRVVERVAAMGWVVPRPLSAPVRVGRHLWCLFSYVPGTRRRVHADWSEREAQRSRGRLLAELHADLATIADLGQRPGWLRRDEVLGPRSDGPTVEEAISAGVVKEDATVMLAFAARAKRRLEALRTARAPLLVNHGDLNGSNVLYRNGQMSGIIDFDFTHLDFRAADFAWTWRGRNDDFVYGYEEVTRLSAAERDMLAPAFWVTVLESARMELLLGGLGQGAASMNRNGPPPGRPKVAMRGNVAYLQRESAFTGQ
jgi:Ser/Thr protein kinase RdoA (MazF antagonist)